MVKVKIFSTFSQRQNTMMLDLTKEEWYSGYNAWKGGVLVQNAFPTLNADEREFIMTGTTPEEWDEMMGPEE